MNLPIPNNCIIVDFQRRCVVTAMPVLLPKPVRGVNYLPKKVVGLATCWD